ncbi:hypothetical protein [Streptomyces sp. L-9-10]|uniref:hypothetical protein n=1 Tax=Streptomyces sp. L-9-10 TaxID=1478131 RepID=UPI00101CFB46|nr:hypothetical protein [Streptomyces sp. L-9-10]
MTAETGRDRQIHREFEGLLPRQYGYAGLREQLGHPGPERRRTGPGGEQLHPQIVAEQRQDVQ